MYRWESGFSVEVEPVDARTLHVRFQCPWCGNNATVPAAVMVRATEETLAVLVVCQHTVCRKPAMVVCTRQDLGHQVTFGPEAIFPSPLPEYAEPGVPLAIAGDFQEALRCRAAGFLFGAAVVGRRVLQSALVEQGALKHNLVDQINELPEVVLPARLKEAAQHVRLIGNDAAHANQVTAEDLERLISFVRIVLHQLYVLPHELGEASKVRQIPAKHLPSSGAAAASSKSVKQ